MREIPLTKNKVAIIDDSDYEKVSAYKWHASVCAKGKYIYANSSKAGNMHRFILSATGDFADKINRIHHDPLPHRRRDGTVERREASASNRLLGILTLTETP